MEVISEIQKHMIMRGWKLSVAESLTSGNIQALLTSISDSSKYFEGGVTAYSLDQKVAHLGVDYDNAYACNCVSERVAGEMAIGVSKTFNTDFGISTTGYAEPSLENNVDDPYAFVSLFDRTKCRISTKMICGRGLSRSDMQKYVSEQVLAHLHQYLSQE